MTPPNDQPKDRSHVFQSPKGTRDFYPLELARRRWIEDKWRQTSIRHGFDEIDGPTFEHLDLYTVKSGEGIVSELFSFTRQGGDTRFALRPEFTPTLARMAAAKANSLTKPTKWFSICPYFRAERPQRGRLREFLQWNVDVIGDDSQEDDTEEDKVKKRTKLDAECIACCVDLLRQIGLTENDVQIQINDRRLTAGVGLQCGVSESKIDHWFAFLDGYTKRSREDNRLFLESHDLPTDCETKLKEFNDRVQQLRGGPVGAFEQGFGIDPTHIASQIDLLTCLADIGLNDWCNAFNLKIVRGLAYYTGTVFEVHEVSGSERAIAGGGRYDKLIELFNGPTTPAVGFAMGDVVLSLVLQDKGLMPSDEQIAQDLGLRPDVFIIPTAETEHLVKPLVAQLRREGMHARHTYKATRNVGKLLKEANNTHARFAMILETDSTCTIKDLDSGEQEENVPTDEAIAMVSPPPRSG